MMTMTVSSQVYEAVSCHWILIGRSICLTVRRRISGDRLGCGVIRACREMPQDCAGSRCHKQRQSQNEDYRSTSNQPSGRSCRSRREKHNLLARDQLYWFSRRPRRGVESGRCWKSELGVFTNGKIAACCRIHASPSSRKPLATTLPLAPQLIFGETS